MQARLNYRDFSPECFRLLVSLDAQVRHGGLEASLLHLVKMRASQINGCVYCISMHSREARAAGETEQRLYGLDAWREAPYYTDRERAALEWTEAVTLIASTHVPDSVFEAARAHFSEKELVDLNYAVVGINAFNRLAIAFRTPPEQDAKPAR